MLERRHGRLMLGRSWTWVIGELLVVLPALALAIAWVATSDDPSGDLVGYVVLTSGPLLGLALLAVWHARAAGWILIGIGAPLLLAFLWLLESSRRTFGDPASLADVGIYAFFAAPPVGGVLLVVAGRSARGAHAPRPHS